MSMRKTKKKKSKQSTTRYRLYAPDNRGTAHVQIQGRMIDPLADTNRKIIQNICSF